MKKAYVKPELMVEYFTLAQNIAATCSGVKPGGGNGGLGRPNHWDKGICGWVVGDISLWTAGTPAPECSIHLGQDEEVLGVCYTNPSSGYSIFGS